MDKYEVLNQIGDGTFGSVAKAVNKKTGQLVAIKKMKQKFYTWEECVKLPEVDVVRRLHRHPNIVKLTEVIRENNELFFVFECMDGDLLGVIKKCKQAQRAEDAASAPAIPYPKIKHYMRQILQSLAFLHKRGYFHRDLKPENLLIRKEGGRDSKKGGRGGGKEEGEEVVKLADFGLVKEIRARPPFTDYVSTRWYRAPELLLQDRAYGAPVDIFAAACIMSELITTRPLFPGSNEVDQLFKIMSVLGSPTDKTWPGGLVLARKIRYTFPSIHGSGLAKVLPSHVPAAAVDLMQQMLQYDPKLRPTAEQCLAHPYFNVGIDESHANAGLAQRLLVGHTFETSPQSAPTGPPDAEAAGGGANGAGAGGVGGAGAGAGDAKRFLTAQQLPTSAVYPSSVSLGGGNHPGAGNTTGLSLQKFYMLPTALGGANSLHGTLTNNLTSTGETHPILGLDSAALGVGGAGTGGSLNGGFGGPSPYKKSASPKLYGHSSKVTSPTQGGRFAALQSSLKSGASSPSKSGANVGGASSPKEQGSTGAAGGSSTLGNSPVSLAKMLASARESIHGIGGGNSSLPSQATGGAGALTTTTTTTTTTAKDPLGVNLEELLQEFSNELNGHLGISAQTVKEYSSPSGGGSGSKLNNKNNTSTGVGGGATTNNNNNNSSPGQQRKASTTFLSKSSPKGSTACHLNPGATGTTASTGTKNNNTTSGGGVGGQQKPQAGGGGRTNSITKTTAASPSSIGEIPLNAIGKEKSGISISALTSTFLSAPSKGTTSTTTNSNTMSSPTGVGRSSGMPTSTSFFGGGKAYGTTELVSSPRQDPITALLQHSRYKSSSFQGSKGGLTSSIHPSPLGAGKGGKTGSGTTTTTTSTSTTLEEKEKSSAKSPSFGGAAQKTLLGGLGDRTGEGSGGTGGVGITGSSISLSPAPGGNTGSGSPSIRAFLARRQQNLGTVGGSTSGKKSPTIMGFT